MQVEQQTVLPPSLHSSPTVRQQHHQSTPPHPAPRSISQTPASPPKPSQPIPMQTYPPGPSAVCTPPPSSPVLGAGPSPRNHFRAQTLLTAASISPTARFLCLGDGKGLELMDDFQEGARLTTARGAGAATAQTAARELHFAHLLALVACADEPARVYYSSPRANALSVACSGYPQSGVGG